MDISNHIKYVGVDDLRDRLFENQWTLPHGVSYNSYLVVDEKIALIDTAAAAFGEQFISRIKSEIGERKIDYLVVNHMEPDHSALMSLIRSEYPDVVVIASARALPMIKGFQGIDTNVHAVAEGESVSLGSTTLTFHMIPMVHWPETMVTYVPEEKTVFSGDAFGCFGAVGDKLTDRFGAFRDEMVRYYASIVGKYGQTVQAALKKTAGLDIARVCSTHGPVWETRIPEVVALYDRMSRYETAEGVCIIYGSMYGNTAAAAEAIYNECTRRGVKCVLHDAVAENPSFIYKDVFEYDTVVCGAPTYNGDIFPAMREVLYGIVARQVKNHRFAAFGSYSWAGASVRLMNDMAEKGGLKVVSEGLSFNHAFAGHESAVSGFVDKLLARE